MAWLQRATGGGSRIWLLVGFVLLGLVPRLAVLFANRGEVQFWEYETLAQNIARGVGYVIPHFGHLVLGFGDGNLYSFLAGAVYAVFGHRPLLLATVQAVLASLAVPVIYVIGERSIGPAKAALGATLAALHPGLLAYTLKLHPLGMDVLLLALLVFWGGHMTWSRRDLLGTGLSLGLNLMSRPTFFVACVAGLGLRCILVRRELRALAAAVALGLVLAMPWVARNAVFLGRPVLITTSLEDVWKGNNPRATGSGMVNGGQDIFDVAPLALRNRLYAANELELNDVFAEETMGFIRQQPGRFAGLVLQKFVYFWSASPQTGLLYPAAWTTAYDAYAVVVYGFALVGALAIVRAGTSAERTLLGMLVAISMSLAIIHALAYVEGRHRWGIEPLLLLLTARGIFTVAGVLGPLRLSQLGVFRRESAR